MTGVCNRTLNLSQHTAPASNASTPLKPSRSHLSRPHQSRRRRCCPTRCRHRGSATCAAAAGWRLLLLLQRELGPAQVLLLLQRCLHLG